MFKPKGPEEKSSLSGSERTSRRSQDTKIRNVERTRPTKGRYDLVGPTKNAIFRLNVLKNRKKSFFQKKISLFAFFFITFCILIVSPLLIFVTVDTVYAGRSLEPHKFGYDDVYRGINIGDYGVLEEGFLSKTVFDYSEDIGTILDNDGKVRFIGESGSNLVNTMIYFKINAQDIISEGYVLGSLDIYCSGYNIVGDYGEYIWTWTEISGQKVSLHDEYYFRFLRAVSNYWVDGDAENVFPYSKSFHGGVSSNYVYVLCSDNTEDIVIGVELYVRGDSILAETVVIDFWLIMYSDESFGIVNIYRMGEILVFLNALFWLAVIMVTTNIFHIQDMIEHLKRK